MKDKILFIVFLLLIFVSFFIVSLDNNKEEEKAMFLVGVNPDGSPICFESAYLTPQEFENQQQLWLEMFGYRYRGCN